MYVFRSFKRFKEKADREEGILIGIYYKCVIIRRS